MRNILLTGSPGTGKTFLARAIAYYLCIEHLPIGVIFDKDVHEDIQKIEDFIESDHCEFVQVHPAMSYEDVVYGIDIKAQGSLVVSYTEHRVKQLCDRANSKDDELFCVIFDDISQVDASVLLGDLLYAMDYRDQPIQLIDGQMLTVPQNVFFIFTECSDVYGCKLDYALRRRMDYVKELASSKAVIERYYNGSIRSESADIIINIFNNIKKFVTMSSVPDTNINLGKYIPGHGMFMVERTGTSYLVLDKVKGKIIYQVFPYIESLLSSGIISGDVSSFFESIKAMINTGISELNYIDEVRKVMVGSGNVVSPFSLSDTENYYRTTIIPDHCTDHKGMLESVIDAVILNGVIPYDIAIHGLLLNIQIASIPSKSDPITYASYWVKKQDADGYYYNPSSGGDHAYYITNARRVRKGRWAPLRDLVGYEVIYRDGSPSDFYIPLNGVRSHTFNMEQVVTKDNAAEVFASTYRLIDSYLCLYEQNISLIKGSDKSYIDLDNLLLLELKYLQALKDGIRQHSGEKAKTKFYGAKLLQFRTLWTKKGMNVEADESKFNALIDGSVEFCIDSYEDIYNITSGKTKSIEIKGVVKMTDLKDYQKIMENIGVRQMIFQGPPGTSKTFESKRFVLQQINSLSGGFTSSFITQEDISRELAPFKITEEDYSNPTASSKLVTGGWDLVQFHPSYCYEDFIRGIEVKTVNEMPAYNSVNRILGKIAEFAKISEQSNPGNTPKFYLVIDEINRANVATVFGELIYGLEYRDSKVSTPYEVVDRIGSISDATTKDIVLGKNLFIVGTMNTADKSIDAIDYAIRRRFIFIDSPPDRNVVINCYKNVSGNTDENSIELLLFDAVQELFDNGTYFNNEYQKSDVRIGHTYFLRTRKVGYEEHAIEHFVFQVIPILREYVKDGILDSVEDLIAKEHEVSQIRDAGDREKQLSLLSDNIMVYVKEFGSVNKNGRIINNEYVGEFIETTRTVFGF